MNREDKEELVGWACDNHAMILGLYRDKVRHFTVTSLFRSRSGGSCVRAFDSTHQDEEMARTYRLEDMVILGLTRYRPKAVIVGGKEGE